MFWFHSQCIEQHWHQATDPKPPYGGQDRLGGGSLTRTFPSRIVLRILLPIPDSLPSPDFPLMSFPAYLLHLNLSIPCETFCPFQYTRMYAIRAPALKGRRSPADHRDCREGEPHHLQPKLRTPSPPRDSISQDNWRLNTHSSERCRSSRATKRLGYPPRTLTNTIPRVNHRDIFPVVLLTI